MSAHASLATLTSSLVALVALAYSGVGFGADDAAIKAMLKKNDCFKCHAIDKTKKGPSYKKIAATLKEKEKGDMDAAEKKIIKHMTTGPKVKLEDGTEEDHKIIETKDPAELKAVAEWILSQ